MVSITIENAGWPRIGRITTRSSSTPNSAIAAIGAGTASQNGKPSERHQRQADEGAEHHQLALREAHRLGGLVDQHEAQRDQAVDAALRDAADDDLQSLHGSPRCGFGSPAWPPFVILASPASSCFVANMPATRERTNPRNGNDNRRGELVRAAAQLFREKGFEGTTIRDIAGAVGMQLGQPLLSLRQQARAADGGDGGRTCVSASSALARWSKPRG